MEKHKLLVLTFRGQGPRTTIFAVFAGGRSKTLAEWAVSTSDLGLGPEKQKCFPRLRGGRPRPSTHLSDPVSYLLKTLHIVFAFLDLSRKV